ncbi:MAG: hypothetical protein JO192_08460, partial [Candidatus Eremiobacteraeota bacterium]|nr:hypothetical protein [Candidatus Eremiobacteraeota bacterium]
MYEVTSAQRPAAQLPGSVELPPTDGSVGTFWNTIVRRRAVAAAIFAVFVVSVIIGTLTTPKRYTTQIKFIAGNPQGQVNAQSAGADSTLPVLNALLIASGVQSAETYAELFQETPVAQRVIADLNLHASPGQLLKNTTVKPVTNTSILTLGVTWSSPDVSAAIANDFGKVIIDRQRELVAAQASSAIKFLQQQIPEAEARERAAAGALARFEAANHIADISQQTQNTITELASLDAQVSKAQVDHEQSAAQLGSVRGQMSGVSQTINGGTSVAPNPVVAQLQQQLSQVNVQLDTARRQYTEQHPAVTALENQQAQLKREIASTPPTIVSSTNTVPNPEYQQLEQQATQLQSQESADTAQIAALKNQEKALNPTLAALPAQENQLADLQRNAKSAQDVLAALQQKYDDAEVAKTTALSDVTITQPASAQSAAVSPNLLMNTVIAVFLGTILALGGALLVDYFDNSIKTEGEAEQRLSLPNLGTIPLV